jgi:3-deoxy-D-manno-octulosonic-acid transferase
VDEVGRLAELYTVADIACVGGGLDGRGLHNVLEPAAAGIPVLFGPRHDRRDAHELAATGGGFECRPDALSGRLLRLLDPAARARPGGRAREYVESGAGAAEATAALLAPFLFPAAG